MFRPRARDQIGGYERPRGVVDKADPGLVHGRKTLNREADGILPHGATIHRRQQLAAQRSGKARDRGLVELPVVGVDRADNGVDPVLSQEGLECPGEHRFSAEVAELLRHALSGPASTTGRDDDGDSAHALVPREARRYRQKCPRAKCPIGGPPAIGYCVGRMKADQVLGRVPALDVIGVSASALLAPMSGVTDVAFRRIAARYGAGLVLTEMVACHGLVGSHAEATLRSAGEGLKPHAVQLVGRDPAIMAEAARIAEGAGADLIDINLGCPAKRVVGGLGGSALMREPALAVAIASAVVAAVTVPVTVKMRLGWDDRSLNAADLAIRLAAAGVRALTVHGRTRQQFYEGRADWRAIRAVVEAAPIPVVANGDVSDAVAARTCLSESTAAAVMVGRAALGQPWIVGEIASALDGRTGRAPGPAERASLAVEHYEALLTLYGRDIGIRHARKHLAAYAERAAEAGRGLVPRQRDELVRSREPARVISLLSRLYDQPLRRAA